MTKERAAAWLSELADYLDNKQPPPLETCVTFKLSKQDRDEMTANLRACSTMIITEITASYRSCGRKGHAPECECKWIYTKM